MAKIAVYDITGKEVENIDLKDDVFAAKKDTSSIVTEAVLNELANKRRGTARSKTRGEVSGGGRKPWKQKGTGRARHGSTREPQWRHGGTAHGAKVRDYSYVLPKKVKSLAYRIALTESFNNKSLIVLSDLKVEKPMTKKIVEILNNLKLAGIKTLIIVSGKDENLKKSVNNMADAKLLNVSNINCHDLLKYEKILFTKDAILNLEKQL